MSLKTRVIHSFAISLHSLLLSYDCSANTRCWNAKNTLMQKFDPAGITKLLQFVVREVSGHPVLVILIKDKLEWLKEACHSSLISHQLLRWLELTGMYLHTSWSYCIAALSYNNFDACIQAKSSRWQRTQAYLLVCAGLQMSEGVPVCWSPDKRTGCRATLCALSVYAGRDSRVSHLWFILQTNKSR